MNLKPNIIIREEKDCYLLYNDDNGSLISLTKEAYREFIIHNNNNEAEVYRELREALTLNGFLEQEDTKNNNVDKVTEVDGTELRNGFFDLRSDLNPLNVLWAITPVCNLRCVYCFPDAKSHMLTFTTPPIEDLLRIAEKLVQSKVLKVTLSGGECLLMRDVWTIVKRLRDANISVAMISNGTTISQRIIEKIKESKILVAISLDAPNEEINKITRGKGVFAKATQAIRELIANGIQISVLVTLTRYNFSLLEEQMSFLWSLGVKHITLQDLRPFGTPSAYNAIRLTPIQESELKGMYQRSKSNNSGLRINPTELFIYDKNDSTGKIMQCPAGDNFAYIDFYGDLYPCTSLPSFKLGNLFTAMSITELWQSSEAIQRLRRLKSLALDQIPECSLCSNKHRCEGGCRGDAEFYSGDLFGLPSRCPKALNLLR